MEMKDKTVVLGVTGSIAAYKAAELASQLAQVDRASSAPRRLPRTRRAQPFS